MKALALLLLAGCATVPQKPYAVVSMGGCAYLEVRARGQTVYVHAANCANHREFSTAHNGHVLTHSTPIHPLP